MDCAAEAFIARGGYERTQMEDVAAEMGIAKGTLYLYVQSKEALFDLVFRHAAATEEEGNEVSFPVPTPAPGALLDVVAERIRAGQAMPTLEAALRRPDAVDLRGELEGIVREIYGTLHRNRRAIKLIGVSALDMPALAELWFKGARLDLVNRLDDYLRRRSTSGTLRAVPDTAVAARLMVETISWFAVHRHWDPVPQDMDEAAAEDTVVRILVAAFAKDLP